MRETVSTVRSRFRARRWQRWSEVPPEDDYLRWARAITVIATLFFLLVFVGVVLALVLR
jgi:hypothetical protein